VSHNPVRGVKRPKSEGNEGKTPALVDGQARSLFEAPPADTLKGRAGDSGGQDCRLGLRFG
jgi:integrase/recombinase XerD